MLNGTHIRPAEATVHGEMQCTAVQATATHSLLQIICSMLVQQPHAHLDVAWMCDGSFVMERLQHRFAKMQVIVKQPDLPCMRAGDLASEVLISCRKQKAAGSVSSDLPYSAVLSSPLSVVRWHGQYMCKTEVASTAK